MKFFCKKSKITMQIRVFVITNLLFTFSAAAFASSNDDQDFHARVVQTYGITVHKLSKAEIETQSKKLDDFWNFIKQDSVKNVVNLRAELKNSNSPSFFYYDGSKLLLSISKSPDDQALALEAMQKADMQDIDMTDYLRTVHKFACDGFNTTGAAMKILDYPEFKAFIPQHALMLGQDYAFIYMLFPANEKNYLNALISRLSTEKNTKAQKSLLLALWYTVTPEGNQAINQFIAGMDNSEESRLYAKSLLERKASVFEKISISSYDALKEERRKNMYHISDEALMELDSLTLKMLAKKQ